MAGLLIQMWVCLDGSGTIAILDDLNVDSAVDNGTGDYTFNIGTDYANDDYAVAGMCMLTGGVGSTGITVGLERQGTTNPAPGTVRIECVHFDEVPNDADFVGLIASGTP